MTKVVTNTLDRPERMAITPAQRTAARLVGFLYLLQMATAIFGQSFVRDRLMVRDDAARTAENILNAARLFRFSVVGDIVTYISVIILIWAFYVLVRPVNRNLALLALLLRLAENAVLCAVTVNSLVVLRLLSRNPSLHGLGKDAIYSLVYVALSTQGLGINLSFVLLGFGSAIFAYLLLKSGYVPRLIAIWGIFSSLLLGIFTLVIFAFPSFGAFGMAHMLPMGLYEVGLGLWLLLKGIQTPPEPQT